MSILSFEKFGYLEEMKDMLEYIIDDNGLYSKVEKWHDTETIFIVVYRRDPNLYKKGNKDCPSNQESANWISEFLGVCRKFDIKKQNNLAVFFSYKSSDRIKSDFLYIPIKHLENIEDSIKMEMKLTQKEESKIDELWITSFEIQFDV